MELKKIAVIHTDFPEKFGIPRQSNLADTRGRIVLEEEYRREEAVRGLEDYSYLWLIWEFSEGKREEWSPTVRPPRLGGNCRMGVFATRSPFRPNPLGLSSVKLDRIEVTEKEGPVLYVTGADLLDGTPIYDIKPYLPYVDSHPEEKSGFAGKVQDYALSVCDENGVLDGIGEEDRKVLFQILEQDPRPSYQNDPERIYGMAYAGMNVKFRVEGEKLFIVGVESEDTI